MNSPIAIQAEGISKQYKIGAKQTRYGYKTLRDTLTEAISAPFRRMGRLLHGQASGAADLKETIWALKDVSFEIEQGEVVGIIGSNGAGKSTLLKILSRITEPTEGCAKIYGRVGSLLEVGTGFHPELTGRENIYLNGAILGMQRAEINQKFDEIVAFAETEKFLDTPVKFYSSGMYVRLAFAVAAHLEPEILLIDEVLAVGDAEFQKKCLGKMGDVAHSGRTVFFVSHNMGAINNLCTHAIWLDEGRIRSIGVPEEIVGAYLLSGTYTSGERRWDESSRPGNAKATLRAVRTRNSNGMVNGTLDIQKPFYIEIEYELYQHISDLRVTIDLMAQDGTHLFKSSASSREHPDQPHAPGIYVSRCEIPGNFLNEIQYAITVSSDIPFVEILYTETNVLNFQIEQTGGISGRSPEGRWPGVICPELTWRSQPRAEVKEPVRWSET